MDSKLKYLLIKGNTKKPIEIDKSSNLVDLRRKIKETLNIDDNFAMHVYSELWETNVDLDVIPEHLTKIYIVDEVPGINLNIQSSIQQKTRYFFHPVHSTCMFMLFMIAIFYL